MLLVDDDVRDVELTLEALDEYNLANEVDVARDGKEALDYLYYRGRFADRTRETPAVVLLDLKMPKVSGIEVLRQIKADERSKDDSRGCVEFVGRRARCHRKLSTWA